MPSPFRHLHHICLVLHDIDAAIAYYESIGIGPWQDYPHSCTVDQRVPGGVRPPEESQTLLTAEPLDLDYEHEAIRRVHQERAQAPAIRAEMQ